MHIREGSMEQDRGGSRTSTKGGAKLNNRAQSGRDHFCPLLL